MENKRKMSKKLLITKILISLSALLFVALFIVVIVQSVKIANLSKELEKTNENFQSEATETQ